VILPGEVQPERLLEELHQAGFGTARLQGVEASLEDVFLALSAKRA